MIIEVKRHAPGSTCTLSDVLVNGEYFCAGLEPLAPVPAGTYDLVKYLSGKFHRSMPLVSAIPGHSYIEIHWGNWPKDTHDCLLVGVKAPNGAECVEHSESTFARLFEQLLGEWEKGPVYIKYTDPIPVQPSTSRAKSDSDSPVLDPDPEC